VLRPGDLVLTPSWRLHDHGNEPDSQMVTWMDALDVPLVNLLDASFFEQFPGRAQSITKAAEDSYHRYGVGHLKPSWEDVPAGLPSPLLVFRWEQTEEALRRLAQVDADPFDDVALQYVNPFTGGAVLPTIDCWIQLHGLRPRGEGPPAAAAAIPLVGRRGTAVLADGGAVAARAGRHHDPFTARAMTRPSRLPQPDFTVSHRMIPAGTIWLVIPPDLAASQSVWCCPVQPFWHGDFASNLPKTCQNALSRRSQTGGCIPCRLPIRRPLQATLCAGRVANRPIRSPDRRWRPRRSRWSGDAAAGRPDQGMTDPRGGSGPDIYNAWMALTPTVIAQCA
jgi:hypothetical protein